MTSGRALLLIADIGGYTEYMSTHRMSLAHVEVNTARMLDRVVDAAPGFELIEIEGDAAFLARPADRLGPDEAVADVVQAAAAMHRAFHLERRYVATNLCPCNGCAQADRLKLKFVAHVGDVATPDHPAAAQAGRDRRDPGPPAAEEPGAGPGVRAADRGPLPVRRRLVARPGARGVAGGRGDRRGPRVLRGRRRPRRPVAAAARADLGLQRIGRTLAVAGTGLPYMVGLRRRRSAPVG